MVETTASAARIAERITEQNALLESTTLSAEQRRQAVLGLIRSRVFIAHQRGDDYAFGTLRFVGFDVPADDYLTQRKDLNTTLAERAVLRFTAGEVGAEHPAYAAMLAWMGRYGIQPNSRMKLYLLGPDETDLDGDDEAGAGRTRQTWLFQANPSTFDIDGFLKTSPQTFSWLVTSNAKSLSVGDRVFLWKAVGKGSPQDSGVVAEAEILEHPSDRVEDPASISFWRGESVENDPTIPRTRVRLKLIRVAGKREVIRRDWMKEDPILRNLTILKRAAGTNFLVSPEHADRLDALWAKTGTDWTYAESVGGLWAYHQTYGGTLSTSPGEPIPDVAVLIGRSVSGVYNKVQNFRYLDPRDARSGFSGGSATDDTAWNRFYDTETDVMKVAELEEEFNRLWRSEAQVAVPDIEEAVEQQYDQQVSAFTALTLAELMDRYNRTRDADHSPPRTRTVSARRFERNPLLAAIAKVRAGFRCEVVGCAHPTFVSNDGYTYMEVHHIKPLSEGGDDSLGNTACLCAAHHREVHSGQDAQSITDMLVTLRKETLST